MEPWQSTLITIVTSVLASSGVWSLIQRSIDKRDTVHIALQALLRDRILQAGRYYQERGYASDAEKLSLQKMYEVYSKGLGGNDVASASFHASIALPTHPPKED